MSPEIAFALDADEALAFAVAFKEMAVPGHFDFDEGQWVEE